MENKYYKWIFLTANKQGLTHILHDKIKDEWFVVHATGYRFPATFDGNNISCTTYFRA